MADAIQQQVHDLATRLETAWTSLPDDDTLATPRQRDATDGRRRDLMNQCSPSFSLSGRGEKANQKLDAEERRLLVLQAFVDEHQPRPNAPERPQWADLKHPMNMVQRGIDFDSGAVKLPSFDHR